MRERALTVVNFRERALIQLAMFVNQGGRKLEQQCVQFYCNNNNGEFFFLFNSI